MIKIIDNFFEDTDTLDWLYNFYRHTGSYQFDYMPQKYVNKDKHKSEVEDKICKVIKAFCAADISYAGKGYEPWINVLDINDDHLQHHVDCSEEEEGIVPAKRTATLYLGPSDGIMKGGELAINVNPYDESEEETFPYDTIYDVIKSFDDDWIIIPYRYNRMIMFDSRLSHAVLPIKHITPYESRISLMSASWDKTITVKKGY